MDMRILLNQKKGIVRPKSQNDASDFLGSSDVNDIAQIDKEQFLGIISQTFDQVIGTLHP